MLRMSPESPDPRIPLEKAHANLLSRMAVVLHKCQCGALLLDTTYDVYSLTLTCLAAGNFRTFVSRRTREDHIGWD